MKQALRTSGANITKAHIVDVSLCSLFLLEAAKKTDRAFNVAATRGAHTTRDAAADIHKISSHLLDKQVTEVCERTTPSFIDPTEKGWERLSTTGWMQETLSKVPSEQDLQPGDHGEIDVDYDMRDFC